MSKLITILLSLITCILCSCVHNSKIRKEYMSESFAFENVKNTKICVQEIGGVEFFFEPSQDSEISIQEIGGDEIESFKKAFTSKYKTNQNYFNIIKKKMYYAFAGRAVTIIQDSSYDKHNNVIFQPNEDLEKLKPILNNSGGDFFLLIRDINIIKQSGAGRLSTGNMATGNTASTDGCAVEIISELWDTQKHEKVLKFTSIGKSTILYFAFETALEEATEQAVYNLRDYVTRGES